MSTNQHYSSPPTPGTSTCAVQYIYISLEEMQAVANYITTKGRVPIAELAAKSNTFIDLEAKAAPASALPGKVLDFDAVLGPEGESAAA